MITFETEDFVINEIITKDRTYKKINFLLRIYKEDVVINCRLYISNDINALLKLIPWIRYEAVYNLYILNHPNSLTAYDHKIQFFKHMIYNHNTKELTMFYTGKKIADPELINDSVNVEYIGFSIKLNEDDKERFCQCLCEICFKCTSIFNDHKPSTRRNSVF